MASKSSLEQQKKQAEDLITCSICLGYFVDPRILPCSHTYCLQCIRQIAASSGGQFNCPLRDGTRIRASNIDSLPINRNLRDMVDLVPSLIGTNDQNRERRNEQQTSRIPGYATPSVQSTDTVTLKSDSETKSVSISNLLSSRTLELDTNKLCRADIQKIIIALGQNKSVKQLTIKSHCHSIAQILAETLRVNNTLTHLTMSNDIQDDSCILISNALFTNHSLRCLNLRRNKITSEGCKAISEMLKSNRTLEDLNICRNKLGDEGISSICEALLVNETLSRLDIYQTNMSTKGLTSVVQMLRRNRTLTWLDIGDNNIDDNGITRIADALKQNNTLTELCAKFNKISETGASALMDALKTNQTLKTIKLQFNNIPEEVAAEIHKKTPQLKITGFGICSVS
ncbi:unnamed protein product [Rotaria sp. Silwood2]|nr:unnamed protein product [Rotaria sp. Silwood2]CAF4192273.1 unnamed protein product [Rotaria sp. Silwood2]CAF4322510.1 unnamed protein product [Rotaria sp. Silwood2]